MAPKFLGRSYIALPVIPPANAGARQFELSSLRLVFKPQQANWFAVYNTSEASGAPEDDEDYLLWAQKQVLLASDCFLLLLDELNRVQLRYSKQHPSDATKRGQLIMVLGDRDVRLDAWNELVLTRQVQTTATTSDNTQPSQSQSQSQSLDERQRHPSEQLNRVVLVVPDKIELPPISGELFVGGTPSGARDRLAGDPPSKRVLAYGDAYSGFVGCVGGLTLNEHEYRLSSDLAGDILDGFDLAECC